MKSTHTSLYLNPEYKAMVEELKPILGKKSASSTIKEAIRFVYQLKK